MRWRSHVEQHDTILDRYTQSCRDDSMNVDKHKNRHLHEREIERLTKIPNGLGIYDYEVHFSYLEHGETKEELVKLKLCLRCAPKIFHGKGGVLGAREAREKNASDGRKEEKDDNCKRTSIGVSIHDEKHSMQSHKKGDDVPDPKRKRQRSDVLARSRNANEDYE